MAKWHKSDIVGIYTGGNYAKIWVTEFYCIVVLASFTIQIQIEVFRGTDES
jgi:hypothetical protein